MGALFDGGVVLAKPTTVNRPHSFRAIERFLSGAVVPNLIQARRTIANKRFASQHRLGDAVFVESGPDLPIYFRSVDRQE
jgi:hypothetical protein